MDQDRSDVTRRSAVTRAGVMLASMAALLTPAATAEAATGQQAPSSFAAQERQAAALVTALVAAAAKRDPALVGALLAEDVVFKGTPEAPEILGRQAVVAQLTQLLKSPAMDKLVMAQSPGRIVTMGGATGTAVMVWREDFVREKDGLSPLPIAAAMWVVGDKIKCWYDWPLAPAPGGGNWSAAPHAG